MNFFLSLAFLFFIGSMLGWVLELFFRRFFSRNNPERKWINPGFLVGPYLPLYGFGLCALYLLAGLEKLSLVKDPVWEKILLFLMMAVAMTLIEYLAGIIFIRGMKVKLWDYSREWGNIGGIICPKFSAAWALLGAVYYFLIHPYILDALHWLSENLAFSFFIGLFFGVFLIDFVYSANLLVKISRFAAEHQIVVKYEELKRHIRESNDKQRRKARFLLALAAQAPLAEHLRAYYEKQKKLTEKLRNYTGK